MLLPTDPWGLGHEVGGGLQLEVGRSLRAGL